MPESPGSQPAPERGPWQRPLQGVTGILRALAGFFRPALLFARSWVRSAWTRLRPATRAAGVRNGAAPRPWMPGTAQRAEQLLWLGFGAVTLLLLILGGMSIARLRTVAADVESQAKVARPRAAAVRELEIDVLDFGVHIRSHLLGNAEAKALATGVAADVGRHLAAYEQVVETPRQRELAARFALQWRELREHGEHLLAAGRASPQELEHLATLRLALTGLLDSELRADAAGADEAATDQTVRALHRSGRITVLILGAGVVIALGGVFARVVLAAQQALRVSEERLAAVVANLTEGLIIGDSRGFVFHWNPAALAMLGYSGMEDCRRFLPDFADTFELRSEMGGDRMPVTDWPMGRVQRGETLGGCILRLRRLDQGWEKVLSFSGSPVRSASGEMLAFLSVTDITARKQAEAERQKFVSLADQSVEFIGMCDLDFKPFYVNEAGRRLIGLDSREQACSVRVQDCFFPEDQEMITREFFPRVVREGRGEVVVRFRHFKTGAALWMIYNVFQVKDEAGALTGYATVSRDITALRQAEDALRQVAQFPQQNPDPVLRIAQEGALLFANPPARDWLAGLGWQPGAALPEAVLTVAAEAAGQAGRIEREVTSPGGRTLSFSAIRPSAEAYVNLYGRDITARKQAEVELAVSRQRFAGIVESAMDAILTIGEDQRILLFNQAAETMFRCPAEEAIGTLVDRFLPERLRAMHREHIRQFGASGETSRTITRNGGPLLARRADGEEFPVEASISKIEVGGAKLFTVILRDITERVRAEDSLKASLQEKEVLLKEIHHRVKNNMQVISSLASLQAGEVQDPLAHSVLQDMSDRVRSMAMVHESLYESPNLARIDFSAYARHLLDYLWRGYENPEREVGLHCDMIPLHFPVNVAVPCGLMLNELAANALKHAFAGRDRGSITVSLSQSDAGRVRLGVRDDGVGLPPGFEWQAARSLGLRLVGMLARQLGAEVKVTCECPGGGTEFAIEFEGTSGQSDGKTGSGP